MKYQIIKGGILLVFSLAFLIGSVFVMVPTINRESLSTITFGYPLGFVVQDFSIEYGQHGWYPPNQFFRTEQSFSIVWWRGMASLFLVWGTMWGTIWLLESVNLQSGIRYLKKKLQPGQEKEG
ncbi:MAG: hypothetical protein KBD27_00255 [Candidatus Moranbacteria bacterium]|nr:hypothetical protein [Candidatus Moranbacteria bacterium]